MSKRLVNASVRVTTQHRMNYHPDDPQWKVFVLSEFGKIEEFELACKQYFQEEEPELVIESHNKSIPEKIIQEFWEIDPFKLINTGKQYDKEKQEALYIWWDKEYVPGTTMGPYFDDFRKEYRKFYDSKEEWLEEYLKTNIRTTPLEFIRECLDYEKLANLLLQSQYRFHDGFLFEKKSWYSKLIK